MDIGLTRRQRNIVRRARAAGLRGAGRWQLRPPLWFLALITLAPLLLIPHPTRHISLVLIPAIGLWQRSRVERRIADWVLDLRQA